MNAADVLTAMLHALAEGHEPALILDENSPLMDAAREALRPRSPPDATILDGCNGLAMRDYFAAKAMQGELSAMQDPEGEVCGIALDAPNETLTRLAQHWYRVADAMLAARERA